MNIQINTSLHRGAFSFSLPKPWKVAAAQRDVSFAMPSWAWGWPSPAMPTPYDANSEDDSTPSSVTLRDFVSCAQLEQRLFHYAQSPGLYSAKRGDILSHNMIPCNLGVVTGKRTSEKCSKPESQENPTDFQCVWCCVATKQLETKNTQQT